MTRMKERSTRLVLDFKKFDIEVFDEFGKYNYTETQAILPTHTHSDMIEFSYLLKGHQEFFVDTEDNVFHVSGGDIFIAYPHEVHGTGHAPIEKGVSYWIVLKRPQPGKDYLGLNEQDAYNLFDRLLKLPNRLFKGDSECEDILQRIIHIYFQDKDNLSTMKLKNLLVYFFLHVISIGEKTSDRMYSECITNTISYINRHIFDILDLEFLADQCNLSLSRFKHLFKKETGIPPSEYITRRKIEKAQELLEKQELSITDIAYNLGFSSPTYFSKVFRKYKSYSPTSYKKGECSLPMMKL